MGRGKVDTYRRSNEILNELKANPELVRFVDASLSIPQVFCGNGKIRLVFLGQDPTVANANSRKKIKKVLDLGRHGHLWHYLEKICIGLDLSLASNIYATNYLKNFFVDRPTQIKEVNILKVFSSPWLPLLKDELAQFPGVPVITLGEPLLQAVVCEGARPKVRAYWGYTPDWMTGTTGALSYLHPAENVLDRQIFPFPHQPILRKQFYRSKLDDYVGFMREHI
jgi:hypothetical protein